MMKSRNFTHLALILALTACTMAPKYIKPDAAVPFSETQESSQKKIAMISWREYFRSADLQRIIALALENNKDLKTAALNIEVAEGAYGVARSNLLPSVNAVGSETRQGVPSGFAGFTPKKQFRANLTLTSYEVDLFGRLRSLKKAALEDFYSTEEAYNVAKISVISETANIYAQYLLDRHLFKLAQQEVEVQKERYAFVEARYKNGIDSQTTLLNTLTFVENSKINAENYRKSAEMDKNALMALIGVFNESAIPQDETIDAIEINEDLLDFVASENLLLRPDVKQAEHRLIAANADIGAARAAFFPTITLTGTYGYASRDLNVLFDNKSWTFTPQITLPIFSGGRNIANLNIADARKKIQIVAYEKAIQAAFREALDQLVERKSVTSRLQSSNKILAARQKTFDFAEKKHESGIISALDVLDSEVSTLAAKQAQLIVQKESIANLIMLYKVMGGGAELEEERKK